MSNATSSVKKKSFVGFIAIMLLLAFSNVFAFSGAADALHFSDRLSVFSIIGMAWLATKRKPSIIEGRWYYLCATSVALMVILTLFNYDDQALQLCNLVVTFGIVFWVQLFSRIKWESKELFSTGVATCLLGIFLNYLFLPGQAWSGWNPNSSIGVVPIFFLGLSCIWCSDYKFAHIVTVPIVLLYSSIIGTLDNRSAFYTVVIFCLLVISRKAVLQKKWYRIVYVSIILLNVLTPYFSSSIADADIFREIIRNPLTVGAEKTDGFNGRETLWEEAIKLNAEHPAFGLYGVRPIYPHNLSMDLLIEYGWLGWLTFYGMVVAIMEKIFRENSKYNIFAIAFVCLIFMNTFENVLSCCNLFVVFPYMLPAVALSIHRSGRYEANGYKLFKWSA